MGLRPLSFAVAVTLALSLLPAAPAAAISPNVVISQVYGGGGNSGAPLRNDFVELFNRGTVAVDLSGWSVQYTSATGTANLGSATNLITPLSGTLAPGRYLLVQEASQAAVGAPLPTPDITDTTPIAMAAGAGKVAVVKSSSGLGCNGGSTPCSPSQLALIADLVGYGNANFFEGAGAAPALSNTTAALRTNAGCTDTDNNSADLFAGAPAPRNSATSANVCPVDPAPAVASTSPASGAAGVATDANVTVTFSEPVNVTGPWYTISCGTSLAHTTTVSGGPVIFTLDPDADFVAGETCTVTVLAAQVSDQDTNDPPDQMAANAVWSFSITNCGAPATSIHDVQGIGPASPLTGSPVTIEGVVVGDFQGPGQFSGFYMQEEDGDADGDAATSEGIFVFSTSPVSLGDAVRVRGTVTEFFDLTELSPVTGVEICGTGKSVTPTTVTLPVAAYADLERYEGMRVTFTQTLTATETFTLGRFGEVRLSAGGRLYAPTAVTTPGAAANAQADLDLRRSFVLDDGNNQQNIDPTINPLGGLSAANTVRSGYTVQGDLNGVFDHRFGDYRLQPFGGVPFDASGNPRTAAPGAVGGNTKVASFNVLNYFNGDGLGGGFPTSRGADTAVEFQRQRAKILSALAAIDADVVGLMEIENDYAGNSAIEDLVAGLNATMGAGTYSFIDTGVIGTDEIRVALIYKPSAVTPVGPWEIIDSSVDPRFDSTKNRPSLAQTFRRIGTTEKFTVVVSHLKSKGSSCGDVGDPDTGDGQGNCNRTRAAAAAAIVDWLATDPTSSGDPDFLLIGDMNSYRFEDPITTFTGAGFANLVLQFGGPAAYSYVFDGGSGYLDHALASASLAAKATGTTDWHINADEPIALDYNVEHKSAGQITSFYDAGPYRSSDHDPVVIGLDAKTTLAGLCVLTRDLVPSDGIATSLCAKLDAAAASESRGNTRAKNGELQAYIAEVRAQRGKAIADADAATLIDLANGL